MRKALAPLAEALARQLPPQSRDVSGVLKKIGEPLEAFEESLLRAIPLLRGHVDALPLAEKERVEEEMQRAANLALNASLAGDSTLQKLLNLSSQTLIWMYEVAYSYYAQKDFSKALSIFQFLTILNPLIADYWVALGLTQRSLKQEMAALYAFSIAALMNPDHPTPRYHAAEIYLSFKQPKEAESEILAFKRIVESQRLTHLADALNSLQNRRVNSG